jgi:integrase
MPKRRGNNEGTIVLRKDGRWMASITIGRNPETGKLKRAYFYGKTRKEAADLMAHGLSDLGRGAFVAPHKMTVGAWLDMWLREYKQPSIRPLTLENYDRVIRCHLKPPLGEIALKGLRPEHVQRLYNKKHQDGSSLGTIRVIHAVLHDALKQALKNQLVVRNVSEAVVLPSGKQRVIQPLSLQQVRQFLTAIADDWLYPAVLLSFGTGLRRGEVLGLRWQDVDLDAGVLAVRQTLARARIYGTSEAKTRTRLIFQEPKTPESRRTIPIPAEGIEALKRHKAKQAQERLLMGEAYHDHGLLFCYPNGRPIAPADFYKRFVRLLRQACMPRIRVHDARHTFATLMLELGESPKTVQTMLGHTTITTTMDIYSHVSLDLEKRAAAKLNEALSLS